MTPSPLSALQKIFARILLLIYYDINHFKFFVKAIWVIFQAQKKNPRGKRCLEKLMLANFSRSMFKLWNTSRLKRNKRQYSMRKSRLKYTKNVFKK